MTRRFLPIRVLVVVFVLVVACLACCPPVASAQRSTTLTAVATPSTTGTLNVYRRNAACKVEQQFRLIASGLKGTTTGTPSAPSTTFTFVDYKVSANQTYCYYVTVSGGTVTFPQSDRYQAVFTTKTVVFSWLDSNQSHENYACWIVKCATQGKSSCDTALADKQCKEERQQNESTNR